MKTSIFAATLNGTTTQIKAYKKSNAVKWFQEKDSKIKASDVYKLDVVNSHQAPIDAI